MFLSVIFVCCNTVILNTELPRNYLEMAFGFQIEYEERNSQEETTRAQILRGWALELVSFAKFLRKFLITNL